MNFTESQKTLTVSAIFHESGLKGWFDTGYPCEIDIPFQLFAVFRFVVKILNAGAAEQHNPRFFGLAGIDQ